MQSFLAFNPCWLSLDWYKNISQIWNLSGNPVQLHVHRKYLHCKIKLYSDKMPLSNPLAFLRPLYDIVVWQFLLMSGQKSERLRTGQPDHVKFMFGMHKVVANFIWKLLEFQAYNHLKQNILETEANKLLEIGHLGNRQLTKWFTGARINGNGRGLVLRTQQRLSQIMNRLLWHGTPTFQSVLTVEFLVQIAWRN